MGVVPRGDAAFLWDPEGMDRVDPEVGSAQVLLFADVPPHHGGVVLDLAQLHPAVLLYDTELVPEVKYERVDGMLYVTAAEWQEVHDNLAAPNARPAKKQRTSLNDCGRGNESTKRGRDRVKNSLVSSISSAWKLWKQDNGGPDGALTAAAREFIRSRVIKSPPRSFVGDPAEWAVMVDEKLGTYCPKS
jgi:hypothetical protein